jgi:hypothetical protein
MAKKPNARKKGVSADPEEKNAANGEVREGSNVDKIRDILFDTNMREYEKRFARLEERLAKSSGALREDLKKRFDSLESYVREEMESLSQRRACTSAVLPSSAGVVPSVVSRCRRRVRVSGSVFPWLLGKISPHVVSVPSNGKFQRLPPTRLPSQGNRCAFFLLTITKTFGS